jgi:protein tyrosine phosphatase (PTP) superfamily phosphohydrolase (DUF442 family)
MPAFRRARRDSFRARAPVAYGARTVIPRLPMLRTAFAACCAALVLFSTGRAFTAEREFTKDLPANVRAFAVPGLHNVFALGTNAFSGSSPESDEAFAALARLGVKTILSVDGARPEVKRARHYGLRYVHLPHGYDGISTNLQLQLAQAGATLPGPIFVHCHRGKHRGPAAAAILCMANDGWSAQEAERWLIAAGTGTNYAGLYAAVRGFRKPAADALRAPASFPEVSRVSDLVSSMVEIDERWERLRAVRAAGYVAPNHYPDLNPANEAVILWEQYREAQRFAGSAKYGTNFLHLLKSAEAEAEDAEQLLRAFATQPTPELRMKLDRAFDAVAASCSSCHKAHRNRTRSPQP